MPETKAQDELQEAIMNVRSDRPVTKRPIKDRGKARAAKPRVQATEWERTDERLDEALRHTFPASDALSIIQNVRDS
jgi:hypothetical protein